MDPSKTEQATPRRRSELRNKGQVAKSQEFNTAVMFLLAVVFMRFYIPGVGHFVETSTAELWGKFPREMDLTDLMTVLTQVATGLMLAMAPLFGVLIIGAVLVNVLQIGVHFSAYPLKPSFAKLNPISGFKRIFSLQPLIQLAQNLFKIALIILISWSILAAHYHVLLQSVQLEIGEIGMILGNILWEIGWKVGLAMLVLAIADLLWQRWYFSRNIRMSKQEIKDELRNQEGDPQIKAKIRQLQRKASLARMMESIPRADVILTNPVHLAVAIAYERDGMNAPTLLAKGASAVAERIKERAREHDVPIVENKELARALYRTTEVGQEIPADLYAAVSEVLIYVYQLTGKLENYLE